MKRNQLAYRLTSWLLALLITFSSASYALADDEAFLDLSDPAEDSYEDDDSDDYYLEDEIMVDPSDPEEDYFEDGEDYPEEDETEAVPLETETPEELFGEFETDEKTSIPDGIQDETEEAYPQLTADDIVRLDGGDAEILYDEEGRVTFIRGRYSPEKVTNYEEAVASLNYVSSLLGLTKGALLYCVYQGIDYTTGYTYYLFLQRDGDVTVVNASIKVYVDPDGYTAALSCSFNPSTGIREETAGSINAEDAERIVRESFPDQQLMVYSNVTSRVGVMENEQMMRVWSVFTNNPEMSLGDSDLPFLQHLVSYSGQYLMNLPCSTMKAPLLERDDAIERRAKAMFEGYEKDTWTGEVTLHDGTRASLTVPVARKIDDGRYYLMDLDRKMLVADYREVFYGSGEYVISSSDTNSGWKEKELIAMYNIGRAYDYFADHGLESVDGIGIPIAILSGVCNPDGSAIDNAYFSGYQDGFGLFAISDINNSVECLDVMAHEFTHGITSYTMGGCAYVNELGAINEAFSDIMGNLCELTCALNDLSVARGKTTGQFDITGTSPYGSSDDPNPTYPDWRIAEMGGKPCRDMSDPVRFRQPAFVDDAYYCLPVSYQSTVMNDYGGVHENSSLLGSIAWTMNEHGLNFERQYSLWMTAMNMMTPKSDYDDILQALIFARKSYGWEEEIDTWLEEAFAQRGLLENCRSYSKKWDGVSFKQYNAGWLEVLEQPQGADQAQTDSAQDALSSLLTGGSNPADGADNVSDSLEVLLTGGANEEEIPGLIEDDSAILAEESSENVPAGVTDSPADPSLGVKDNRWLEGVGLDSEGRIARAGFGRIDFDTAPEDRQILTCARVLEPYTYETLAVNCMDENGHISFLLPEGVYWVCLCVSKGGPNQEEFWPYTKAGNYEQLGALTMFAEVEVKAGQKTELPMGDVS